MTKSWKNNRMGVLAPNYDPKAKRRVRREIHRELEKKIYHQKTIDKKGKQNNDLRYSPLDWDFGEERTPFGEDRASGVPGVLYVEPPEQGDDTLGPLEPGSPGPGSGGGGGDGTSGEIDAAGSPDAVRKVEG